MSFRFLQMRVLSNHSGLSVNFALETMLVFSWLERRAMMILNIPRYRSTRVYNVAPKTNSAIVLRILLRRLRMKPYIIQTAAVDVVT